MRSSFKPLSFVKMKRCQVLLLVILVQLARCNEENGVDPVPVIYEPSWTYKCVPDEGCQRSEQPYSTTITSSDSTSTTTRHSPHFDNINVCRTVCGNFGGLWPRPLSASISAQTVKIHPSYIRYDLLDAPSETHELLNRMTELTTANIKAECHGNVTEAADTPVLVYITVKSPSLVMTWATDEEYKLELQLREGKVAVHIIAETVYGARHGLESFTQLAAADETDYGDQYQCSLHLVNGAKVHDKPAYKHRGFLLDTSRNFIPMNDIKRMINGMAATKMNVFHWHVTDSHSFPLESVRVPQFTRYGAYSASEIYSTEEVRELMVYAQIRGVRIVIEIDAPAHAGNGWQWGKEYGLGDLAVCVNAKSWRQMCIQPPCGQLNPANPHVYSVLKNLYKDLADAIPAPALLHMGGDEVFFNCWNSSAEITSYMRSKRYPNTVEGFIGLWSEFHNNTLRSWDESLAALGQPQQPVMIWSSELTQAHRITNYLDANRYVIEVWEPINSPLLSQLIRLGYQTVSVPKDIWYLDHGFWGVTTYSNWRRMYSHFLPDSPLVLGGEVAMWTELVDDQVLDTRVWPRAAAVAERLWTNPTSSASAAEPRMQRLRERLIARGLRPDALSPGWCGQHDGRCL